MVKVLSLSIALFLTGCGEFKLLSANVDEAFVPYLQEYVEDKEFYLGTRSTNLIDIQFESLRHRGYIGLCTTWSTGKRIILIDPEYWFSNGYYARLAVFYHEMGHCDLGIHTHYDEAAIMNPFPLSDEEFKRDEEFYIKQLFLERK